MHTRRAHHAHTENDHAPDENSAGPRPVLRRAPRGGTSAPGAGSGRTRLVRAADARSQSALVVALLMTALSPAACNCEEDLNEVECGFTVEPSGPSSPIDFGEVQVGSERARTMRITNDGTVGLGDFEIRFSERNGDHYRVAVPPDFGIDVGVSETVSVIFAPLAESTNLGSSFTVTHPAIQGVACGAVNVVVDGDGFAPFVVDDGGVIDDAGVDGGDDAGVDAGDVDGGNSDGGVFIDAGIVTPPDAGVLVGPNAFYEAKGALQTGRMGFASVVLDDGSIIVVGGVGPNGAALDSIERYDPATEHAVVVGHMAVARAFPGAARLADNRVIVVGGVSNPTDGVLLTTVEIFDPAAVDVEASVVCLAGQGTCGLDDVTTGMGVLAEGRLSPLVVPHPSALRALIALGRVFDIDGTEIPAEGDARLLDVTGAPSVSTATFGSGARMAEMRAFVDDGAYFGGGVDDLGVARTDLYRWHADTEVLDVIGTPIAPRRDGALAVLSTDEAIIVGGRDAAGVAYTTIERISDVNGAPDINVLPTPVLVPRLGASAVVMTGDVVLVAGGTASIPEAATQSVVPRQDADVLVMLPSTVLRLSPEGGLASPRHGHSAHVTNGGASAVFIGGSKVVPRRLGQSAIERYDLDANAFHHGGLMGAGTAHEVAAWTPGGGVLSAGGTDPTTGAVSARVRLYDAESDLTFDVPPLSSPRRDHTVTRLADDVSYLVVGGRDPSGQVLSAASIYSPLIDDFDAPLPVSLVRARAEHSSTLLDDGRVLICGGKGALGEPLDTCEIFTPPSDTLNPSTFASSSFVQSSGRMASGRFAHTATRLETGEVLLVGGGDVEVDLVAADLFDPATDRVDETGVPMLARRRHAAVYLGSGRVLVVGGETGIGGLGPTATAEVYERQNEIFLPAEEDMAFARVSPAAFRLVDGSVLITAGASHGVGAYPSTSLSSSELYIPGPFGTGVFTGVDIPATGPRADVVALDVYGRAVLVSGTSRDGTLFNGSERQTPLYFVERLMNPSE